MLELLASHDIWLEYLSYKTERRLLCRYEEARLTDFIENKRYKYMTERLIDGSYTFSPPERKEISKLGTSKKRVVYTFGEDESMILKLLSYLLYKYDGCLSDNCYAFRRSIGAKRAFTDMAFRADTADKWCFKADISNYFNSISIPLLEGALRRVITDDPPLLNMLLKLLSDDRCVSHGEIIHEQKGVMAGTPISPFLANIYLMEMDAYFAERNVIYARYSDDIIIFDSEEAVRGHIDAFRGFMDAYALNCNPDKEQLSAPGEAWSFLGFEYTGGRIDISRVTVRKLMGKIRRYSRSLRRWAEKNGAPAERVLKAFNRRFNRKFYTAELGRELCWTRWYFPIINTADSLAAIDKYMQHYQRYAVCGHHKSSGCKDAPYELLKSCGYRPLVTEYYSYKSGK